MTKKIPSTFLTLVLLCLSICTAPGLLFAQEESLSISATAFEGDGDFKLDEEWDIEDDPLLIKDPYEKYNRFMFNTNDKIYRYILTPLATGYDFLVPKGVQGSINNFINFASTPKRFVNNLFQLKPKSATIELGRLAINASIGIGGLFDPAKSLWNLRQQSEDFGQTLGHYGLGSGPYIVWPVIGPSTPRETLGMGVDSFLSPFKWFSMYDVEPEDAFTVIKAVKKVNKYTYSVSDRYERVIDNAIDPYTALQNAFIQNRNKLIAE